MADAPLPPIAGARRVTPLTIGRPNRAREVVAVARRLGIRERMPWQEHVYGLMTEQLPGTRKDGRPNWAYRTILVTVNRRAGKTTTRVPLAVHRCLTQPGAHVWITAQTRQDARDLLVDEAEPMIRNGDRSIRRRATLRKSQGSEGWTFVHGKAVSRWRVFAPGETAGHGKASDLIDIDEAWSFSLDQGRAVTQAVAATQLTTGGQLSFVSTMGTVTRSRWFHSRVDEARAAFDAGAREGIALVDIGLPEDRTDEVRAMLEDGTDSPRWWAALTELAAHHPAYGYTIETVQDLATVARTEGTRNGVDGILRALGNVPTKLHTPALPFSAWLARQAPAWPGRPSRVVLGVDVGLERSDATIAAAWIDGGDAYIDVIEHRPGADWVPDRLDELCASWSEPPVYGVHGPATETMAEARRRDHTTTILPGRAYATACQGFIDAVTDGARLWHRGAPALNDAVKVAAAVTAQGVQVWTRAGSAGSISAVIAATAARYGALEAPAPGPKPVVDSG